MRPPAFWDTDAPRSSARLTRALLSPLGALYAAATARRIVDEALDGERPCLTEAEAKELLFQAKEKRIGAVGAISKESERSTFEEFVLRFESLFTPGLAKEVDAENKRRMELQQQALEETREQLRELNRKIASGIHVSNMPEGELPGRME